MALLAIIRAYEKLSIEVRTTLIKNTMGDTNIDFTRFFNQFDPVSGLLFLRDNFVKAIAPNGDVELNIYQIEMKSPYALAKEHFNPPEEDIKYLPKKSFLSRAMIEYYVENRKYINGKIIRGFNKDKNKEEVIDSKISLAESLFWNKLLLEAKIMGIKKKPAKKKGEDLIQAVGGEYFRILQGVLSTLTPEQKEIILKSN
ncbi:MAG: hypothetical protein ACRCYT_07670 [Cetobacterium sp.]